MPATRIALDAMGGDQAPGPELEGAVAAVQGRELEVILVGDEPLLRERLGARLSASRRGKLTLRHASQVIAMGEAPASAVKSKKDSSMRVCFNLATAGEADGVVSAGNSGAMLACGLLLMKRLAGVERPGIVTLSPTRRGVPTVVLDVGANTELSPRAMVQLAVLGAGYARARGAAARPRVAVLSNGEEEGKGTELTREVFRLLQEGTARMGGGAGLVFAGYAEGRDFFDGNFDVVVTDGFTGNIALKTSEGTTRFILDTLIEEVGRSRRAQLGAWLMRPALRALKRRLDPDEVGGAPLLGVRGVAMICHGKASGRAIENALVGAAALVEAGLPPRLEADLVAHAGLWDELDKPSAAPVGQA